LYVAFKPHSVISHKTAVVMFLQTHVFAFVYEPDISAALRLLRIQSNGLSTIHAYVTCVAVSVYCVAPADPDTVHDAECTYRRCQ
jgi:methylglyoxal synthase